MSGAAPPAKTQAEIPQSAVEYTITFTSPVIQVGQTRAATVTGVLEALKPWGFSLEGVETKVLSDKLSEHVIIFRRTQPALPPVSLALFYDKIFVSANNLDWEDVDAFISAVNDGFNAVKAETRFSVQSQKLVVGIHIQLKDRPRLEVMMPLISSQALKLLDGELKFGGIILNQEKSSVIIEASIPYANGLWVRIFRDHAGTATLSDVAAALRKDEERLFEVLGLEGVL